MLDGVHAPARAQDSHSPWATASQSAARLVAAGTGEGRSLLAGLEIRLSPGYKTYWRTPGDSGVPPQFDWSASQNLAGVEIGWPAPVRFVDGAGWSTGYVGRVLFPLKVTAKDPSRPVILALNLDYAVCDKLCIPARAKVQLELTGQGSPDTIKPSHILVPERFAVGTASGRLGLAGGEAARTDGRALVQLDLTSPPGTELEDVFVEGPDGWLFGPAIISARPDGSWLAAHLIEDRPKGAAGPTPLLVTVNPKGHAVRPAEFALELDIPPTRP
jgi:DsbC/DsbD-like thiol-disulfide interchange protein